jgi:hypothetical protein
LQGSVDQGGPIVTNALSSASHGTNTPPLSRAALLQDIAGLSHGFFGRRGGVSSGLFASLNAGEGSGDNKALIAENRARIGAVLGASLLLSSYQVHSADVVEVTGQWSERPVADAMVTRQRRIGLCILTADCVPVLLADPEAEVIGAAHAGWKGALAGILPNTVEAMERLGARRDRIIAAIGPAIGQESYEVGPELREAFLSHDKSSNSLFRPGINDRFNFDLPGYCNRSLIDAGVNARERISHDTCLMEEAYFSNRRRNRRGEPDFGRNASVILLQ